MHVTWRYRAGVLLVASLGISAVARAHLMPAQRGTLNVLGNAVFAALSLPVSAMPGVDDNHDGRLAEREVTAHMATLQALLGRQVHFFVGSDVGRLDLIMPMPEPDERDSTSMAGSTHVLVLMKATFRAPPTTLRFELDLFGTRASERAFTITTTRGSESEAALLTPTHRSHRFFLAPWRVATAFAQRGVAHILSGPDHLLFLLTILVAAAGWRHWLAVLTSFTIAHSLTLVLALEGIVRVPARVVEPLIALSIMGLATWNLWRDEQTRSRWRQIMIVFACGLLHGLGFASALSDLRLQGGRLLASLVGFNLGIEVGQGLFVGGVLAVNAGIRWVLDHRHGTSVLTAIPWDAPLRLSRVISWSALMLGTLWFMQRLGA